MREHTLRRGEAGVGFLRHLLGIRLVITALGVLAAVAFSVAVGYDDEMVIGTAAAGVGLVLTVVYGTLSIPLQTSLRLGWMTSLDLLRQLVTVIGLVGLAATGVGIVPLLAVPIPVGLLLVAVTATVVGKRRGLLPTVDREEWMRILRLALPYGAAAIAGVLYAHVSVIGLSLAATERETGLFAAAFRVYFVLATVPALAVATAFPLLARAGQDDRERLEYAVRRLLDACLVIGMGLAIVTAFGAPFAIEVVAGPDYADAVGDLRLLAAALFGTFVIALGGFALLALERYRALLWSNLVGLVLSAGLTLSLAGGMGDTAGAIAVAVGDLTLASLYMLALRHGPDGVSLEWGVALKVLAAGALSAIVLVAPELPSLVAATIAGLIYLVAVVLLRAVPAEIVEALRGARGNRS